MSIENDHPSYYGYETSRPAADLPSPEPTTTVDAAGGSPGNGHAGADISGPGPEEEAAPPPNAAPQQNGTAASTPIHVEETSGELAIQESSEGRPVQLSADLSGKLHGFTRPASNCINKAWRIARELNHASISAAHLVLALTLDPRSSRRLRDQGVDVDLVRETAVKLLAKYNATYSSGGSPVGDGPTPSSDFADILETAARFAKEREDEEEINISDLLDAFPKSGARTELFFGQLDAVDPMPALVSGIQQGLASHLDKLFAEMDRRLAPPAAPQLDQWFAELEQRLVAHIDGRLGMLEGSANERLDARVEAFADLNRQLGERVNALLQMAGRPTQQQPQTTRWPWGSR